MKRILWLLLTSLFLLSACQARPSRLTILDGNQVYSLHSSARTIADALSEAGVALGENDRILYLGAPLSPDDSLPLADHITLTIRRPVDLTLQIAGSETVTFESSALTVGEALTEAGYELHATDRLTPPAHTPLLADLTVSWQPSRELTVTVDGNEIHIRSTAPTVGQALAEAGLPLIGLDTSQPAENEPLPADGQIHITRVVESVALTQKPIPYGTRIELSADLELDQRALLQGGQMGLAIARVRTRSEDGVTVSQVSETEAVVRPPVDEVMGVGTKVVIRTAVVDGVTIEYWRAITMYATYYKPCISGTNICDDVTASGRKLTKGVVAVVYPWYLLLAGERVFVPGYGEAVIADNNGALTTAYGTHWIDLGYAETDVHDWTNRYVTVYFLTPVPANIADLYVLP
jgi:uncharacterized protein YabE (DUF348 family)